MDADGANERWVHAVITEVIETARLRNRELYRLYLCSLTPPALLIVALFLAGCLFDFSPSVTNRRLVIVVALVGAFALLSGFVALRLHTRTRQEDRRIVGLQKELAGCKSPAEALGKLQRLAAKESDNARFHYHPRRFTRWAVIEELRRILSADRGVAAGSTFEPRNMVEWFDLANKLVLTLAALTVPLLAVYFKDLLDRRGQAERELARVQREHDADAGAGLAASKLLADIASGNEQQRLQALNVLKVVAPTYGERASQVVAQSASTPTDRAAAVKAGEEAAQNSERAALADRLRTATTYKGLGLYGQAAETLVDARVDHLLKSGVVREDQWKRARDEYANGNFAEAVGLFFEACQKIDQQ
jgi:hypothetical protein